MNPSMSGDALRSDFSTDDVPEPIASRSGRVLGRVHLRYDVEPLATRRCGEPSSSIPGRRFRCFSVNKSDQRRGTPELIAMADDDFGCFGRRGHAGQSSPTASTRSSIRGDTALLFTAWSARSVSSGLARSAPYASVAPALRQPCAARGQGHPAVAPDRGRCVSSSTNTRLLRHQGPTSDPACLSRCQSPDRSGGACARPDRGNPDARVGRSHRAAARDLAPMSSQPVAGATVGQDHGPAAMAYRIATSIVCSRKPDRLQPVRRGGTAQARLPRC